MQVKISNTIWNFGVGIVVQRSITFYSSIVVGLIQPARDLLMEEHGEM